MSDVSSPQKSRDAEIVAEALQYSMLRTGRELGAREHQDVIRKGQHALGRLEEQLEATRAGLEELLAVAERIRGGDSTLNPEEWYAVRDYARHVLTSSREKP